MADQPIRFDDGAAYERMMGVWSRIAGEIFLDWLAPRPGLKWIDVGCGNGAFTELVIARNAPAEIKGVDPSDGQLAYARTRRGTEMAEFHKGDAMALPFPDTSFDVAIMALVIFFVPDPAKGLAEMVRVVRPGGMVAAYAWDMLGGGFPFAPLQAEVRALGITPPQPPSAAVSRMDALRDLWPALGLEAVETREITVHRTFADFDDFWGKSTAMGAIRQTLAELGPAEEEKFKQRVRARLPPDAMGRITYASRANAVKGRVPL